MTPAEEKAQAEAKLARLNAEQKEREAKQWESEPARMRREAENESAIAKANKEAAEARQSQWTSLVSNLADVPRGETTVSGTQPILGSALAMKGLRGAAKKVAKVVRTKAPGAMSVLVTSDADLATADAAYLMVDKCLDDLSQAAGELLKEEPSAKTDKQESLAGAAGAVAGLIPSVVGMLSAQRSVSTFATSGDDLSAAAAVIGALIDALPAAAVRHDNFRMRPSGFIDDKLTDVRDKRRQLMAKEQKLSGAEGPAIARKEQIKSLIAAIDAFDSSVRAVPSGSTRSALTNAALYEELHKEDGVRLVLLVKGVAGSAAQVVDDRPLWWKDRFSVVATTNITYLLLRTKDNRILSGGTESHTVTVHGKIGTDLEPKKKTTRVGRKGGAKGQAVSGSPVKESGGRQSVGEPGRNGDT